MEELTSNRNAYINVLAAMIGEPIDEQATLIRPEVEETFLMLENNRPELRLFQNQENLIEAQSAIDKSMLYPKIGIWNVHSTWCRFWHFNTQQHFRRWFEYQLEIGRIVYK